MTKVMRLAVFACAGAALGLAGFATSPATANVADFYKGKQVRVVIGFSPGGGFDAYGRLLARHMGKHIPGNPTMIPQNLPGASGLKAVQGLAVDNDGTMIVHFNAGVVLQALTQPDKIKMDFRTVRFLGSMSSDIRVCYAWHATGIRNWDDLAKRPVINLGATSRGSGSYLDGALLRNVMGLNVKQITGYPGSAEQRLAIERGELDGDCGSYESIPRNWVEEKRINLTHRNSRGAVPGHDIPYILDLAKADEQKRVLAVVLAINDIFRPFVVNAAVPADRLKALREAFWATVNDPEFMSDAERSQRTISDPIRGEEAQKVIDEMYATPDELIKKAGQAIE